jgi:hypothetical protein
MMQISGNSFARFCERHKTSPLPTYYLLRHVMVHSKTLYETTFGALNSRSAPTTISTSAVLSLS